LSRIIDEDVDDRDDSSGRTVANQTTSERIVSTTDPQMRHGRQNNQQTYDGHKAHIGVDIDSSIITDIEVTKPSATEAEHIAEAIRRTESGTEASVTSVLGDSAYGTRKGRDQAQKVDVDLLTKTRSPNASWRLGADAFEVSDDGREVTCPAGHSSERHYRQNDGWQHYFAKSDCQDCPLKDQCTRADRRTFLVPDDFHEKKAATSVGQKSRGTRQAEATSECRTCHRPTQKPRRRPGKIHGSR
jgi:hypothetical protein